MDADTLDFDSPSTGSYPAGEDAKSMVCASSGRAIGWVGGWVGGPMELDRQGPTRQFMRYAFSFV